MAQLDKKPYPFTPSAGSSFEAQEAELRRLTILAEQLPKDEVVGRVIGFPIADGKALYYVKKASPLLLQHVAFFDGYQVSAAMIRGLRLDDVKSMVARDVAFREIFNRQAA